MSNINPHAFPSNDISDVGSSGRSTSTDMCLPNITHSISQTSSWSVTDDSDSQLPGLTSCASQTSEHTTEEDEDANQVSPSSPPFDIKGRQISRLHLCEPPVSALSRFRPFRARHMSTPHTLHALFDKIKLLPDDDGYDTESEQDYSVHHAHPPKRHSSLHRFDSLTKRRSQPTNARPVLHRTEASDPLLASPPRERPSVSLPIGKHGRHSLQRPKFTRQSNLSSLNLSKTEPRSVSSPIGLGICGSTLPCQTEATVEPELEPGVGCTDIKGTDSFNSGGNSDAISSLLSDLKLNKPIAPCIIASMMPDDPSPLDLSSSDDTTRCMMTLPSRPAKGVEKPSLTPLRRPTHAPVPSSPLSAMRRPSRNFSILSPPHVPPIIPIPPGLRNSPHLKRIKDFKHRVPSAPVLSSKPTFDLWADGRMHRHAAFAESTEISPPARYTLTPPVTRAAAFQSDEGPEAHNPYFPFI